MDDLRFYVLFNSISVILGQRADDNEMLCAMEPRLRLRRVRLMVFVINHETLWKSNDTRNFLGPVLPSGQYIPRFKFSLGNTKPEAVSITNAESVSLYSAILSL